MSYSKQALQDAKNKLRKEDPSFFKGKSSRRQVKQTIVRSTQTRKKKIVKWNYKVNDLVKCTRSNRIGLIVSDNQYFGETVEKNYYFVLFNCSVQKYDGSLLRTL